MILGLIGGGVYYYLYVYNKSGVEYKKLSNTWFDANGGDIKRVDGKDGDVSPCEAACTADKTCDSFTVNHDSTQCFLRTNKAGNARKNDDWDTYIKQTD